MIQEFDLQNTAYNNYRIKLTAQTMGNCTQTDSHNNNHFEDQIKDTNFNPFYQPNLTCYQNDTLSKYQFISNYSDLFLGRASVLKDKSDGNLYILKQVQRDNQLQLHHLYESYTKKRDQYSLNQNILNIKEVFKTRSDGFFTDSQKIILILDYPLISLKKQFNNRLLNKLIFETDQIVNIMQSTIRGYAAIQRSSSVSSQTYGKPNDKVRMANIFIGVKQKSSLVKVVDSSILPGESNVLTLINNSRNNSNLDVYLAPEQLNFYSNNRKDGTLNNSGVFSLGMTLIDLCLMNSSSTLYYFNKKTINQSELKNMIKIAGKNHNLKIQKIIGMMLQLNPQKRPTFNQLQRQLRNNFNNLNRGSRPNLQLSSVRDQSEYIVNDSASLRSSRSRSSKGRSLSRKGSIYSSQSLNESRAYSSQLKKDKAAEEYELQNIHEEYTNGNQYIGQKKNSLKHGKGKYIFKDRSYYEGKWKNNMMHGKGILYYSNGKIQYKGQWKADEPNGWGQMYPKQRSGQTNVWSKYEGQVLKGQMHGKGKLTFQNGSIFQGQFFGNKIFGKGKLTTIDNNLSERQWQIQTLEQFDRNNINLSIPEHDLDNHYENKI